MVVVISLLDVSLLHRQAIEDSNVMAQNFRISMDFEMVDSERMDLPFVTMNLMRFLSIHLVVPHLVDNQLD